MQQYHPKQPHILFLFTDAGGGHRSAAEAVIEALHLEYGDQVSTEMVDFLKDYAPWPFDQLPAWYPPMVSVPQLYGLGFRLSNHRLTARALLDGTWPYVKAATHRLIDEHPCEMIVSVHAVACWPIIKALGQNCPTIITIITDLISTHVLWYHPKVDLCLAPTEAARQRALRFGLKPERVQVVGLPVGDRFCQPLGDKKALRLRFGWPPERPLVFLVGGGEGMGPLEKVARAISHGCPAVTLVVVAGRNQELKQRLEEMDWPIPVFVYGFVHQMPEFMRAADILVTKAGPGTICEALIAGLPMVLFAHLPGQEEGNVMYVVSEGAGTWAPHPDQIVAAINYWLDHPEVYSEAIAACQRLARPQAARQIAQFIAHQLGITQLEQTISADTRRQ